RAAPRPRPADRAPRSGARRRRTVCEAGGGSLDAAATSTRGAGAATGGRSSFTRYPDLLRRPPTRPLERHVVVVAGALRIVARPQLVERLDLEFVLPQQPNPVRVRCGTRCRARRA